MFRHRRNQPALVLDFTSSVSVALPWSGEDPVSPTEVETELARRHPEPDERLGVVERGSTRTGSRDLQ